MVRHVITREGGLFQIHEIFEYKGQYIVQATKMARRNLRNVRTGSQMMVPERRSSWVLLPDARPETTHRFTTAGFGGMPWVMELADHPYFIVNTTGLQWRLEENWRRHLVKCQRVIDAWSERKMDPQWNVPSIYETEEREGYSKKMARALAEANRAPKLSVPAAG